MSDSDLDSAEPETLEPLRPEDEARLEAALVAAARPSPIAPSRHEAILAACVEDPLAPPSDAERDAASKLREALETGGDHPDARLARLLAQSAGKTVDAAGAGPAVERALGALRPRSNVVFAVFGAGASLAALAAAVALLLLPARRASDSASEPGLEAEFATSRSLAPLFSGEVEPSPSARLDRIQRVRARELRDNRYLSWGVR